MTFNNEHDDPKDLRQRNIAESIRERMADGHGYAYAFVVGLISAIVDSPSRSDVDRVADIRAVLAALEHATDNARAS